MGNIDDLLSEKDLLSGTVFRQGSLSARAAHFKKLLLEGSIQKGEIHMPYVTPIKRISADREQPEPFLNFLDMCDYDRFGDTQYDTHNGQAGVCHPESPHYGKNYVNYPKKN